MIVPLALGKTGHKVRHEMVASPDVRSITVVRSSLLDIQMVLLGTSRFSKPLIVESWCTRGTLKIGRRDRDCC